ncbi:hypothetical protein THAOC_01909 [Thalassiosira oceanica]|uniref:Uncharacterized protein n=1 Tax=Thalassiosira oceanica TaxID=159749 RepID=K0TQN0_THAOC|nr:hypothetical protein THAOC_01909 [Thalassiosira oceanica]|eukprot:EJK76332.1 hypothetical protein THAOC_01909 [Thalassiosira oceanica]
MTDASSEPPGETRPIALVHAGSATITLGGAGNTTRVTYYVNTNRTLESMSKSLRRYCNIVAYLRGRMDLLRPPRATLNPMILHLLIQKATILVYRIHGADTPPISELSPVDDTTSSITEIRLWESELEATLAMIQMRSIHAVND